MTLIQDDDAILRIAKQAKRVAVLGIKTEDAAGQPAFYVPQTLARLGVSIVPIPIYYPDTTHILGKPVFRRVSDVPGEIDILDVFRRPSDLMAHVEDIVRKKPRLVWLQSGIRSEAFALAMHEAGIDVVEDRCLMVEFQR
jgi:predicted CoA-binding protein